MIELFGTSELGGVGQFKGEVEVLSIYDSQKEEFRMMVYENDGVLRVFFHEPVVIITEEEDLKAERMEGTH